MGDTYNSRIGHKSPQEQCAVLVIVPLRHQPGGDYRRAAVRATAYCRLLAPASLAQLPRSLSRDFAAPRVAVTVASLSAHSGPVTKPNRNSLAVLLSQP